MFRGRDGADPHVYLNKALIEDMGISDPHVEREIEVQANELRRREAAYARHLQAPELEGKTVIVTDGDVIDMLRGTASTMRS